MKRGTLVWLLAPIIIAAVGVAWMQLAVWHYERVTGRKACGLAGYHYSSPEWGFQYHPGGERIHRWTTIVPSYTTLIALGVCLLSAVAMDEKPAGAR